MNLARQLDSFLTPEASVLIQLIKAEAERLDLPVYLVGGSVRDLLLGRVIHDFDLTVEGDAKQIAEAVLRKYAGKIVFHSRFGTATWTLDETTYKRLNVPLMGQAGFPPFLDFISARSETYFQPGALPTVKRSNIDDDLRRRDFTINAMALRLDGKQYGDLHDPLSGQKDLERKLIRILHPRSFIDDPTRMFRAIRYSIRYGFELETDTHKGLFDVEARTVLSRLSGERLRHEFDLIFEEQRPLLSLAALEDGFGLTKVIHPALANGRAMLLSYLKEPSDEFGTFETPDVLSLRQVLNWVLYLIYLSESEINSVAERLAFPNLLTDALRDAAVLIKDLSAPKNWKPSQWTFHLDEFSNLSIYAAYLVTKQPALETYLTHWQNVKPTITGNDLKDRGLEPGPKFAEILRQLRTAWLDGKVSTKEEENTLLNKLIQ